MLERYSQQSLSSREISFTAQFSEEVGIDKVKQYIYGGIVQKTEYLSGERVILREASDNPGNLIDFTMLGLCSDARDARSVRKVLSEGMELGEISSQRGIGYFGKALVLLPNGASQIDEDEMKAIQGKERNRKYVNKIRIRESNNLYWVYVADSHVNSLPYQGKRCLIYFKVFHDHDRIYFLLEEYYCPG